MAWQSQRFRCAPGDGFDFGDDGLLYAPQPFLGQIVRIDPDSGALSVVVDGLPFTTSVGFDAEGQLFASLGEGRIVAVDTEGGTIDTVARIRRASSLDNMVFDAKGRLYVSDAHTGAVFVIGRGGGARTLVKGGLILPGGVAVMPRSARSESLFVADAWRLVEYDARSGRRIDIDASDFMNPYGVIGPWTVAPDGGNVILTYGGANTVQVWDPRADQVVETFTEFDVPWNALRFQDDLVVAEVGDGQRRGTGWPGGPDHARQRAGLARRTGCYRHGPVGCRLGDRPGPPGRRRWPAAGGRNRAELP